MRSAVEPSEWLKSSILIFIPALERKQRNWNSPTYWWDRKALQPLQKRFWQFPPNRYINCNPANASLRIEWIPIPKKVEGVYPARALYLSFHRAFFIIANTWDFLKRPLIRKQITKRDLQYLHWRFVHFNCMQIFFNLDF